MQADQPAALPPALGEALERWRTEVESYPRTPATDASEEALANTYDAFRRPRASGENAAAKEPC